MGVGYTTKTDIWSFGCMMLELCNKAPPRRNVSTVSCLFQQAVFDPPVLEDALQWSPLLRDFVSKCLVKDQHERWGADELLQHDFIATAIPQSELAALFVHVFLGKALKAVGLV